MFPQIFGKYVLERELASGGMAVVYLATLRGAGGFEKRLVVKQIRAELASDAAFVERFVAEAKTTVGLSHSNIVPVYELGVEQGVYFIAMELAQGVTLADLLKTSGRLSPTEGAYLGVEVSRALDYAHRKAGIVHRDVTPRNVIIDDEGAVRLIDFGIAAPVTSDETARERVYGSPGHMPPEQLHGGRLTPATDVFAVGALLLEAWTGEPPFRRKTRAESDAALEVPAPPPSRVDPELSPLDDLLARAVAREPEHRPQTPEDFARPLREFLRTADLGDIARRLGDRVRRVRRTSKSSVRPPAPGEPGRTPSSDGSAGSAPTPATPSTRPLSQPVTETFAVREEVSEWTKPISVPPPDDAPAASPMPHAETAPPAATAGPTPGRAIAIAVGSVLVAGAIGIALAFRGEAPSALPPVPAPVTAVAAVPSPSPARDAVPVPTPTPSDRGVITPPGVTPPLPPISSHRTPPSDSAAAVVPSGASDGERADVAVFTFTADLPARASLDGSSLGSTPVRSVRKPPGRHVITFVSAELGEQLSASVVTAPGQSLSIHAEFTRAVPAIRIH